MAPPPLRSALYAPSGAPRGQGATPFALYAPSGAPRGQGAKGGAPEGVRAAHTQGAPEGVLEGVRRGTSTDPG